MNIASNISVTYDGSPATVRSFADGDVVTVNLVNGKIASLAGESKTTTIKRCNNRKYGNR